MKSLRSTAASLLAAFTFLAGSVVIPTVHLAFHSVPHEHPGGGLSYHTVTPSPSLATSLPAHHHDQYGNDVVDSDASPGDWHTHPVDDDGTTDTRTPAHQHDRQPFDPHHGDGSAAHFALALSDGAAHAIVPLLSPGPTSTFVDTRVSGKTQLEPSFPHADRGPPFLQPL